MIARPPHRRPVSVALLAATAIAVATATACHDATGPAAAAGAYVLDSVQGKAVPLDGLYAPLGGTIVLARSGTAERSVTYRVSATAGDSWQQVMHGHYSLRVSTIALRLNDQPESSALVWSPAATLADGVLTLRYPDPADGPDIVEVYRRR